MRTGITGILATFLAKPPPLLLPHSLHTPSMSLSEKAFVGKKKK
jgi:hypothetical protein